MLLAMRIAVAFGIWMGIHGGGLLSGQSQESEDVVAYPEVVEFAEKLKDVRWTLRGTSSLKGLQFDGESMLPILRDGSTGSPYPTVFPDLGVVRLEFRGGLSGWFFFSDDLQWVTALRVGSERVFRRVQDQEAKYQPDLEFPESVTDVIYESTDDDEERAPGKFRWKGNRLEFATKPGDAWQTVEFEPDVADRRVFEAPGSDEVVIWFVISADGEEAWFLEVQKINGGHRADRTPKSALTASETGLNESLTELENHMMDLMEAGQWAQVRTLQRQFSRILSGQEDRLEALKKRVQGR